jgi:hypothetical protein
MEEGACFDPSGKGYYTVGEKGSGPVYLYYYPFLSGH